MCWIWHRTKPEVVPCMNSFPILFPVGSHALLHWLQILIDSYNPVRSTYTHGLWGKFLGALSCEMVIYFSWKNRDSHGGTEAWLVVRSIVTDEFLNIYLCHTPELQTSAGHRGGLALSCQQDVRHYQSIPFMLPVTASSCQSSPKSNLVHSIHS